MGSRDEILRSIRRTRPGPDDGPPLPPLAGSWTSPPDRLLQFERQLRAVGGELVAVAPDGLEAAVRATVEAVAARVVWSAHVRTGRRDVDLTRAPHDAATVDFALVDGAFGVAENGAVWVTERGLPHRAVLFLAQHLGVVVSSGRLVDHMHAAYAEPEVAAVERGGFGVFISGPSKTADIEQALVLGAHGPRTLTVYLVGE